MPKLINGKHRRVNDILGSIPSILLFVMFLVILIVSTFTIIAAFSEFQNNSALIISNLDSLKAIFAKVSHNPNEIQTYINKTLTVCQQENSQMGLNMNMTKFLFELFSLALVTIGVYILNRSHQEVKSIERKANELGLFALNIPSVFRILSYIMDARSLSHQLKRETVLYDSNDIFTDLREDLRQVNNLVIKATEEGNGIDEIHYSLVLDIFIEINNNLNLPGLKDKIPADILNSCVLGIDMWKQAREKMLGIYENQRNIFLEGS